MTNWMNDLLKVIWESNGAPSTRDQNLGLSALLGCLFVHGNGQKLWKKVVVIVVLNIQFNSQLAFMNEFANLKP